MRKKLGIWAVVVILALSVLGVATVHVFAAAGAAGVQYNYTGLTGSGVGVFNPNVPGYESAPGTKGQAGVVYSYASGPVSVYNAEIPGYELPK